MSKTARLIELIMYINAKKRFTVNEAAEEFGVSYRTILRDLHDLSGLGVPLYSEVGVNGGYSLLNERALPPILLLESEALALFFSYHSLQFFGALPFDVSIKSVLTKVQHYLPKDVQDKIDRLKDRLLIWNPSRLQEVPFIKLLLDAAVEKKCLKIDYDSRTGARTILPIGLYSYNGYWYCPAYCFKKNDFRLFRADRIKMAEPADFPDDYSDIQLPTVSEWLLGEEKTNESVRLYAQLTQEGVRRLDSDLWLGSNILRHADGSGTLNFMMPKERVGFYGEILWGLGENVKIIEPQELKSYLKQKLVSMMDLYA